MPENCLDARMVTRTSSSANEDTLNAQEFTIAFVISVTETSDDPQNWIAKKGKDSIFAILHYVFPEVLKLNQYILNINRLCVA